MNILQSRFALIRRYVLGVLLLVPLFLSQMPQPKASLVNTDPTGVVSLNGVPVGTQLYDARFEVGTFNDVFPGAPVIPGITNGVFHPNAVEIVEAINAEINALYDTIAQIPVPLLTADLQGMRSMYYVPLALADIGLIRVAKGTCGISSADATSCDTAPWSLGGVFEMQTNPPILVWAVVTPTPVPLPAALPLFGSALAMLGIVGWRRKRRGDA